MPPNNFIEAAQPILRLNIACLDVSRTIDDIDGMFGSIT
jgi:hypothetical protein